MRVKMLKKVHTGNAALRHAPARIMIETGCKNGALRA